MSSTSLHVAIRIKPSAVASSPLTVPTPHSVCHRGILDTDRVFQFDKVYHSAAEGSQALIYHDIGSVLIRDMLDAVNICVMSYGQSGTGRSYTMLGTQEERGLVPRMCDALFAAVAESAHLPFLATVTNTITVSGMYVFNEKVYDAVVGAKKRRGSVTGGLPIELRVREHPDTGPYVEGLQETVVTTATDLALIYFQGDASRPSPRAHFILSIRYTQVVEQPESSMSSETWLEANVITRRHSVINFRPTSAAPKKTDLPTTSKRRSNSVLGSNASPVVVSVPVVSKPNNLSQVSRRTAAMTICDLASVDRSVYEHKAKLTTAEERTLGGRLNLSLSCLGRVIGLLAESKGQRTLLPYRDSTLTWILKDKLSGNCKTLLIATVSLDPKDTDNTLSTLLFAERARCIKTTFQRNIQNENSVVAILRELTDLYAELNKQRGEIRRLLAPYQRNNSTHVNAMRGLSLSTDVDFFGGQCLVVRGQDLRLCDEGALVALGEHVDSQLRDNLQAMRDILVPFLKSEESSAALACVMHQLGVFRVDVLKEILPQELQRATEGSQHTLSQQQHHRKSLNGLTDDVGMLSATLLEKEEEDGVAPVTIDINGDDTNQREGEHEVTFRLRLKIRKEEMLWAGMLAAGDAVTLISAEESRTEYVARQVLAPSNLKMGRRLQRTVHVCKLTYSTWDTEFVDTNYGSKAQAFIYKRYNSLSRACLVAEDGDVIEVHEGTWNEAITLIRDVEVCGVGPRDRVVIKSPSPSTPTITLHTVKGCCRNLTLHHNGGECCVMVRGGAGELDFCSISAYRCRAGVRITGHSANPWIHDCYIHDCSMKGCGILIDSGGRGVIEKNDITRCGSAAVVVEGSASHPHVFKNTLSRGKGAGVACGDGARGLIEDNSIEHNACAGVLIESRANPTVRGNQIKYNLGGGVIVSNDHTMGLLEGNTISDNCEREVFVEKNATPQLRKNKIFGGTRKGVSAPFGVVVTSQAQCLLVENEFEDFEGFCVACRLDGSWTYLIGNTFRIAREASSGAVSIFDRGNTQLRYNSFFFEGQAAGKEDRWVVNPNGQTFAVKGNKINEKAQVPPEDAFWTPSKFEQSVMKASCGIKTAVVKALL